MAFSTVAAYVFGFRDGGGRAEKPLCESSARREQEEPCGVEIEAADGVERGGFVASAGD